MHRVREASCRHRRQGTRLGYTDGVFGQMDGGVVVANKPGKKNRNPSQRVPAPYFAIRRLQTKRPHIALIAS